MPCLGPHACVSPNGPPHADPPLIQYHPTLHRIYRLMYPYNNLIVVLASPLYLPWTPHCLEKSALAQEKKSIVTNRANLLFLPDVAVFGSILSLFSLLRNIASWYCVGLNFAMRTVELPIIPSLSKDMSLKAHVMSQIRLGISWSSARLSFVRFTRSIRFSGDRDYKTIPKVPSNLSDPEIAVRDAAMRWRILFVPALPNPIACSKILPGPQTKERACLRESGYKMGDIYPSFIFCLFCLSIRSAIRLTSASTHRFLLLQSGSSSNRTYHSSDQNVFPSPHPHNLASRNRSNDFRPRPSQLKASFRCHSFKTSWSRYHCSRCFCYCSIYRVDLNYLVYLDRLDWSPCPSPAQRCLQ